MREQEILDGMGSPTWSAYVMGAGLMGIDPAAEQRLEKALIEFESAEAHWSDVAAMIEADPVHRELLDKLEIGRAPGGTPVTAQSRMQAAR